MTLFSIAAVAVLMAMEPTGSGNVSTPPAPPAAQPQQQEAQPRQICRRVEASESRTAARRVCKTEAEWRAYDRSVDD